MVAHDNKLGDVIAGASGHRLLPFESLSQPQGRKLTSLQCRWITQDFESGLAVADGRAVASAIAQPLIIGPFRLDLEHRKYYSVCQTAAEPLA